MKLTLHCLDCQQTKTVHGRDVPEVIEQIDTSGWMDVADHEHRYGPGHLPAYCQQHRTAESEA